MRDGLSLLDQLIAFGGGKAGEAEARPRLRARSGDVPAADEDSPAGRPEQTREDAEQRGLPRPIRTDKPDDGARRDFDGHIGQGDQAAEANGDVGSRQGRHCCRCLPLVHHGRHDSSPPTTTGGPASGDRLERDTLRTLPQAQRTWRAFSVMIPFGNFAT